MTKQVAPVRLAAGSTGSRAFGGAALAAIVRAAAALAPADSRPHSLHAHFLSPARPDQDATLSTRLLRASASFTAVEAEVLQEGLLVASGTVSFHRPRPSLGHEVAAMVPDLDPAVAPPAFGGPLPAESSPSRILVDLREADASVRDGPDGRPVLRYWVRYRGPMRTPVEQVARLAWVSDLCLTRIADLEHDGSPGTRQGASLDHAMWFHRPADLRTWLLYELTSPVYVEELALSTGRFFDRSGVVVASVTQQSLLRRRP